MRDFKRLQQDPPAGISGAPYDNNIMLWNVVIFGLDDTPWDGGTFKLTLQFSKDYPNKPPTVQFLSRMFHPNNTVCWKRALWIALIDEVGFLMAVNWELFIQCIINTSNERSQSAQIIKMFFTELLREIKKFEKQPKKWKDLAKEGRESLFRC